MALKESTEHYLEMILIIMKRQGIVRGIDIVHESGFSKPSVSIAMKKLKESHYIEIDDHGYIDLTDSGSVIAHQMVERHATIYRLLILAGVNPDIANQDACKIEHVLSEESYQSLKKVADDLEIK